MQGLGEAKDGMDGWDGVESADVDLCVDMHVERGCPACEWMGGDRRYHRTVLLHPRT